MLASVGTILEGTLTFIIRYDQDYELTNDMKVAWKNKSYKLFQSMKERRLKIIQRSAKQIS